MKYEVLMNTFIKNASRIRNTRYPIPDTSAGFTLIEVVIVLAIVAMSSYILVDLFLGQNKLYKTQTAELNITNDARMALDEIDSAVRQGSRIIYSHSGYESGTEVLIVQIQSINSTNQLIPGTFDHIVFYKVDASDLMRQVFPDPASSRLIGVKKLASNVMGLSFGYDELDFASVREVSVDLTIQEFATYQNRTITISSKSKLRNY